FAWGVMFAAFFVSVPSLHLDPRRLSRWGYLGIALLGVSVGIWAISGSNTSEEQKLFTRWGLELFHILPSAAAFLMLFFVFDPTCPGSRILGLPWLRFIGIVSYEWFLFHQPVVVHFHKYFGATD